MSVDIGIDLGTASVLVYVRGKGVVLKEPSVVAFDRDTNVIKAIGEEARMMLGRTPGNIVAVRPLRQGVISDYTVTEKMIKYFVQKALGKRTFKKPRISICVPSGVTEVEKKAVEDLVNEQIERDLPVTCEEMPIEKAREAGATGVFGSKYGEVVKVYTIGDFSKEICGGPHAANTAELGKFRIVKEQSSSAGVRRIKAVLE